MRWFKHWGDARHNPKLKAAQKQLGEAAYARFFKLVELVAQRGGKADDFRPLIFLTEPHTDLHWLADELGITVRQARKTLGLFARLKLVDPDEWSIERICIPQMTEYLDEWTGRHHRNNTRSAPETSDQKHGKEESYDQTI